MLDKIFLIESDIKPSSDSAEEARVRYVALTRPKTQFVTMKKNTKSEKSKFVMNVANHCTIVTNVNFVVPKNTIMFHKKMITIGIIHNLSKKT